MSSRSKSDKLLLGAVIIGTIAGIAWGLTASAPSTAWLITASTVPSITLLTWLSVKEFLDQPDVPNAPDAQALRDISPIIGAFLFGSTLAFTVGTTTASLDGGFAVVPAATVVVVAVVLYVAVKFRVGQMPKIVTQSNDAQVAAPTAETRTEKEAKIHE